MRDSISGAWMIGFVAVFIVMFAAYLVFAMAYSKAHVVKNNIIDIIEREGGMTRDIGDYNPIDNDSKAIQLIDNYLKNTGYLAKGTCPEDYEGYHGGVRADGLPSLGDDKSYFCIRREYVDQISVNYKRKNYEYTNNGVNPVIAQRCSEYDCTTYYRVIVFFDIDLPVIGVLSTFKVNGETINIYYDRYVNTWNVPI